MSVKFYGKFRDRIPLRGPFARLCEWRPVYPKAYRYRSDSVVIDLPAERLSSTH
jgi:hypothetical protein